MARRRRRGRRRPSSGGIWVGFAIVVGMVWWAIEALGPVIDFSVVVAAVLGWAYFAWAKASGRAQRWRWYARRVALRAAQRAALADIQSIDRLTGPAFEHRLRHLFSALGYRVELTPGSGDFGADLILGRGGARVAVQAKRYAKPVGVKAVQEVAAARSFYGASGAAVITNGAFTPAARRLAASCRVELWDTQWLESALRAAYLSPAPVAPATAPQMARP